MDSGDSANDEHDEAGGAPKKARIQSGLKLTKKNFIWDIEHFDMMLEVEDTSIINLQSVTVSINHTKSGKLYATNWKVSLLESDEKPDCIGIFHELLETPPDMTPDEPFLSSFRARIHNQPMYEYGNYIADESLTAKWLDPEADIVCGWPEYVNKNDLPDLLLETNGVLSIEINLAAGFVEPGQFQAETQAVVQAFEYKQILKLTQHHQNIWINPNNEGSIKIISKDGSEHNTNKLILSERSTAFKQMFEAPAVGNQIQMDDATRNSVKVMLTYIHTGKVLQNKLVSSYNIVDAAHLAHKYELLDLLEILDQLLLNKWNKLKALKLLETTAKLRLIKTNQAIADFIARTS